MLLCGEWRPFRPAPPRRIACATTWVSRRRDLRGGLVRVRRIVHIIIIIIIIRRVRTTAASDVFIYLAGRLLTIKTLRPKGVT